MPRGPTTYTLPPGTTPQSPNTVIGSAMFNAAMDDIATTFNTAQPVQFGGTGLTSVVSGDVLYASAANTIARLAKGTAGQALVMNSGATFPEWGSAGISPLQVPTPVNLALVASVGSNALTVAVKGVDGNDPSASNPVYVPFRNVTATSGIPAWLTLSAASSIVISSGSTLGMTSAVAATLAIVAFNDAGTFRLGIINPLIRPLNDGIASSTAEGGAGAADSAGVIYTGTAVTSKAMTVLGYATVTEATAGTWATAPSTLKVGPSPEFNNVVPQITPWVAYTPTFTGFGTVSSISMFSRRVGDSLEVQGRFTTGTHTATEARMSIGFNGVDGNVTADSTKVASLRYAGPVIDNIAGAFTVASLMESSVSYLTFGLQGGATSGLTKANGDTFTSTQSMSIRASIPITGW